MKRISTSLVLLLLLNDFAHAVESKTFALTSLDFSQAQVISKNGKVVLQATLTDSALAKLKERPVGEKLTLMNGDKVIATPVIRIPVGRRIEIDALSKPEAEDLARLINH